MQDWQGNRITINQKVLVINVIRKYHDLKSLQINKKDIPVDTLPEELTWDIEKKYVVVDNGHLVKISKEQTYMPINLLAPWLNPYSWQIIAIEGISDNQDAYLKYNRII